MRRRTTLLFNGPSIRPGFLGNLRRRVGQLDRQHLALGRRVPLELDWTRNRRRLLPLLASLARRGRIAMARLPFPHPLEAPAAPEVKVKEPGKSRPDGTTLPLRVGGCLALHWRRWQAIGAETWVVTVLRDGYRVPFLDSPPPLSRTLVSFPTYRAGSPRAQALRQEIEGMLAKGALEIARDTGPGFYSRLFQVEKASGGWRPMIDLSHLNKFVQLTPFKMETVVSVLLSVREGDFLASLDLKGAYFQIPIHRSSRKLLRFTSEGTVYQFQALCFGLSTASQVFTRVFAVVSAWAHSHGIRLLCYLVGSLLLGAGSQAGRPVAPLALSYPRDCDKRKEVGSRALADCEVPRHDHRYRGRQGFSVSGARREIPDGCRELLYHGRSLSSALAGDPRSPGFARAAGSSRSPSDAHVTVASEGALVPRVRPSLTSSVLATGSETGPVLVDGEGSSDDGGSIRDTCSRSSPVFGRVLFEMGCSPSQSIRVRGVVRPGEVAAHQSSRNEGCFLRPSGIPRRCHRSSHDSDVRQLDGRGVRQQARGYGFPGSMLVGQPPSEMDGEFRHPSQCKVSTRTRQCPGRCPQPSRASSRDRVVSPPSGGGVLLRVWGNPSIDLFATCLNTKLPLIAR